MSMEELSKSLAQVGQEKQILVQHIASTLLDNVKSLNGEHLQSVTKLRENMQEDAKTNRSELENLLKKEREKSQQAIDKARTEAELLQKRIWTRTIPAAVLCTLAVCAIAVGSQWWVLSKGTGLALADLQQKEAAKLAELRTQSEQTQQELQASRQQIQQVRDSLAHWQVLARLDIRVTSDGRVFGVTRSQRPEIQTWTSDNASVVEFLIREK